MDDIFPQTLQLCDEVKLLSNYEVQKITMLNTKLFEAEKAIWENSKKLKEGLEAKKVCGEIYEYSLETYIRCFSTTLGDGAIFESFSDIAHHCNREEFDDWNDMQYIEHPLFTMKHSWLFHDLYDHINLSLRAIALIDRAIWETTVTEEYAVRFDAI